MRRAISCKKRVVLKLRVLKLPHSAETMDCCILHSRQYRAVFERLVNSMSAAGLDRQFLTALRQRQCNELCTCSADISAKVSPPLPCTPQTPLPETSSQQENEMSSGPEVLEDAITRQAFRANLYVQSTLQPCVSCTRHQLKLSIHSKYTLHCTLRTGNCNMRLRLSRRRQ